MKTIETTGKTVDEAIYNGLVEMGLSIDEVDIEILKTASKGFLGLGGGKVTVRLTEKEHASIVDEVFRGEEKKESGPPQRNMNPSIKPSAKPQEERAPRAERARRGDGRRRERDRQRREHRERPVQVIPAGEKLETCQEAEFLHGLLERMGMEQTVIDSYAGEDGAIYLLLSGPGMGVLIGRRGETLNALQYVVSLYTNKGEGDYRRIILDTENYRVKRETALKRLAERKAAQVLETGRSISMEPMTAQERRILHAQIQTMDGVTTHSEGEEPNRYVVIEREH